MEGDIHASNRLNLSRWARFFITLDVVFFAGLVYDLVFIQPASSVFPVQDLRLHPAWWLLRLHNFLPGALAVAGSLMLLMGRRAGILPAMVGTGLAIGGALVRGLDFAFPVEPHPAAGDSKTRDLLNSLNMVLLVYQSLVPIVYNSLYLFFLNRLRKAHSHSAAITGSSSSQKSE